MLKRMTRRTFFCLILFIITVGIGVYVGYLDIVRRNIHLTENNVKIVLSEDDWTTNDVTLTVDYLKSSLHIKEYSFDNGKTWTKNNTITVDHNQLINIVVKDVNNKIYKVDYEVTNIDREGPVVLLNDNIQVSLNSSVDLKQFVTYYDEGSGLRDEVVITPQYINTSALGEQTFWVYTIDNLANRTITQMTIEVVRNAPIVLAQSISTNYRNLTIGIADEKVIIATILPVNTTDKRVTWTSSNPEVATVDNVGRVIGVSKGSTTISATTSNGIKTNCIVIVK